MRRLLCLPLALCLTATAVSANAAPSRRLPRQLPGARPLPLAGTVIVVDPGHNGGNFRAAATINRLVDAGGFRKACNTTGTSNSRMTESAFNWQLANRLKTRLNAAGATVVLTRSSDSGVGPCVDARGKLASRVHANLLISLHADGAAPSRHGFHVIYPAARPGYTDGIVEPSSKLATQVRDSLLDRGLSTSNYLGRRGLNQRGDLGTLNWARVPAVMLEAGNMANSADAALLASPAGQTKIVDGLASAVIAHAHR